MTVVGFARYRVVCVWGFSEDEDAPILSRSEELLTIHIEYYMLAILYR